MTAVTSVTNQMGRGMEKSQSFRVKPEATPVMNADFERMVQQQDMRTKGFRPKFKLKTNNLKKVLYNLKREKEFMDKHLE